MLDLIGVIVIVVLAALFVGRSFYRTVRGKDDGCSGCVEAGGVSCTGCDQFAGLFGAAEPPTDEEHPQG